MSKWLIGLVLCAVTAFGQSTLRIDAFGDYDVAIKGPDGVFHVKGGQSVTYTTPATTNFFYEYKGLRVVQGNQGTVTNWISNFGGGGQLSPGNRRWVFCNDGFQGGNPIRIPDAAAYGIGIDPH